MMSQRADITELCRTLLATTGAALSILIATAHQAWPQSGSHSLEVREPAQPATPSQDAPQQPEPQREQKQDFFDGMGKLFDQLPSILPTLKSPSQTIDDLSRMTKPASMVSGRAICPVSANGAPDCKLGADKLCQAKGYKEGKSLSTDSAETCSAKVLIPGRQRKPDDCRTDNYVTRALCQ